MEMTNSVTSGNTFRKTSFTIDITFRLAQEDDLQKLEWLGEFVHFRRVFQQTYQDQLLGHRLMLIADLNNYPIGQIFILLKSNGGWSDSDYGYLYSLRVMTPFQGLGIGTHLILQAEALIQERELEFSTIAVAKDNPRARKLYERLGYKVYSSDDGRWSYQDHKGQTIHVYEPCWMMEKRILPSL